MIYITGDIHGNVKQMEYVMERINTNSNNTLIVLGDFGGNYYCNKKDNYFKDAIKEYGINIFAIRGNHDANPIKIKDIEEIDKYNNKGYIQEEYPEIFYAKNGEEYIIEGSKFLVLGGAYSVDKFYRLEKGWRWFSDEQMSESEKDNFWKKNIKTTQNILSHTCPYSNIPRHLFLSQIVQSTVDNSMEMFLEKVKNNVKWDHWFFGHYHANEQVEKNMYMLYDGIIHYKPVGQYAIY